MKTLTHAVLACLCLAGTGLSAQTVESGLEPRIRARIVAPNVRVDPIVGRVLSRDSTSLVIRQDITREHVTIAWPDIQRAERSRGHNRGAWAAAGFGLGLVGGVAVGAVVALTDRGGSGGANLAPIGFGLGGMLGGTVLGALAAPERWSPVAVPPSS